MDRPMNDEDEMPATTGQPDGEVKGNKPLAEKTPSAEDGGPKGPEPTRYGDWEKKGRCIDF